MTNPWTTWELLLHTTDTDGNRDCRGGWTGSIREMPPGLTTANEAGMRLPRAQVTPPEMSKRIRRVLTTRLKDDTPLDLGEAERMAVSLHILAMMEAHPSGEISVHWD